MILSPFPLRDYDILAFQLYLSIQPWLTLLISYNIFPQDKISIDNMCFFNLENINYEVVYALIFFFQIYLKSHLYYLREEVTPFQDQPLDQ